MEKLGSVNLSSDILRNASIGLWAFELDEGKPPRMYVDDTMLFLMGLSERPSPEETYHAWYDYVDPRHLGVVATAVEKMTAGLHAEVQYPWHHPDGRTMWVRCGGVRNAAYTQGVRIEGCHRDVTDLIHFQHEEKRHVIEALGSDYDAIFELDFTAAEMTVLRPPTHFRKIPVEKGDVLTMAEIENYTRTYLETMLEDEYRPVFRSFASWGTLREALAHSPSREITARELSGAWIRFKFCSFGEKGENVILAVTYLDRYASERAALQKEREQILDMLHAATWSMDIAPDGQVCAFACSESVRTLLGIGDPGRPIDNERDILQRIHPDDLKPTVQAFWSMAKTGAEDAFHEFSYRSRAQDGTYRRIRSCARFFRDAEGRPVRAIGVFTDVTSEYEKAQLTERLSRALAEAKAAEQTKTSFLATMSHEIRTPLNAVIGFADFLQDQTLPEDERCRYLAGITRSSHALLSLINDILDLSKLEAGKVTVRGGVCNVAKLLDEMKSIFHFNAARKGIEIGSEIADDFPDVALKEERVRQILLNLVGNAVKFTNQGHVVCKAGWRPSAPGRGTMMIQVRDTGIGIPKAKQAEIFNPFVQGGTVRGGQVYEGTGLGLPICRRLVEAVGGTISVESTVGKGTTFTVCIPDVEISESGGMLVETLSEPGLEDVPLEAPKQLQVVAVDDVPLNLVVIEKFCEKAGVPKNGIRTFQRAREALAYLEDGGLQARPRTIVFTDMWMPEMTGEEFVRSIRGNDALKALPVVAVTADAETSGSYDMSLFDEIITKPITGAKVKSALARLSAPSDAGARRKIRYVL